MHTSGMNEGMPPIYGRPPISADDVEKLDSPRVNASSPSSSSSSSSSSSALSGVGKRPLPHDVDLSDDSPKVTSQKIDEFCSKVMDNVRYSGPAFLMKTLGMLGVLALTGLCMASIGVAAIPAVFLASFVAEAAAATVVALALGIIIGTIGKIYKHEFDYQKELKKTPAQNELMITPAKQELTAEQKLEKSQAMVENLSQFRKELEGELRDHLKRIADRGMSVEIHKVAGEKNIDEAITQRHQRLEERDE